MTSDARTAFWQRFLVERLPYPAPERLRAQLAAAEVFDVCACGCNSFAVRVPVPDTVAVEEAAYRVWASEHLLPWRAACQPWRTCSCSSQGPSIKSSTGSGEVAQA